MDHSCRLHVAPQAEKPIRQLIKNSSYAPRWAVVAAVLLCVVSGKRYLTFGQV